MHVLQLFNLDYLNRPNQIDSCIKINFFSDLGYFFVMSSYAVTETSFPHAAAAFLFFCVSKNLFTHTLMLAETVASSISDILPPSWRSGHKRYFIDFVVCFSGFLFSLIFLTKVRFSQRWATLPKTATFIYG